MSRFMLDLGLETSDQFIPVGINIDTGVLASLWVGVASGQSCGRTV